MPQPRLPASKILVVDDEPSNVRLLERMLELFGGLEWRCTTDPREAIPLFAEFQPDLVLTDLHMPHLDGYQVIEQLKQIIPEDSFLPIVVLTADITPETRRKALYAGASDFITKPLDTTEVQLRLRNLLENRFLNLRLEDQVRQRTVDLEIALDRLQNAQEQVVKTERLRALGMMAGGIAHDFNNALTMVLGYGELLLPWFQKEAANSREHVYVKHIVTAAQDATHVVSRLRDFYRPADEGELRVPLDPKTLCEQAIAFTTPKWKVKARALGVNISIETDYGDVPKILGCGPELRESLTNLIFNAVDAMPQGGTITVRTSVEGDNVRIGVTDTGTGMTADEKARCLEPFFTTKGERGTGLGLAVVYGIIQRHGGMIEIDSEKGKGTTFSFVIPATQVEATEIGDVATPVVDRALNVLVVDDQEIICELIAAHLMSDGHQPVVSSDAIAAQQQFESGTFDLLITDQSMPGLSGEQLATNVKKTKPGAKVIMLTGFGDDVMANGNMPQGVDRVLSKPVSCEDLRRAIFEVAN